ncbi:MAG: tol-pal system protein YbgF [Rhodobacterales bacterium]|nr:tol-pal system protein YbgF [Rhodobacterales bacterium]
MRILASISARVCLLLALATAPTISLAQSDTTLADIRQELTVLHVEMQRLNRELSTTGNAGSIAIGGSALQRLDAIERELQRLTAKTEELEFRINRVVKDGTNRIGDLEFRLVELEGGDVGALGETTTLGGVSTGTQVVADTGTGSTTGGTAEVGQLAIGEATDFERAEAALDAQEFRAAADQFTAFSQTYPGSPLETKAQFLRGKSLEGAGDITDAARAYLAAFSRNPKGPVAPNALFNLGRSLGRLGQTKEACVTLAEVEGRFPQAKAVLKAKSAMQNLGCQ